MRIEPRLFLIPLLASAFLGCGREKLAELILVENKEVYLILDPASFDVMNSVAASGQIVNKDHFKPKGVLVPVDADGPKRMVSVYSELNRIPKGVMYQPVTPGAAADLALATAEADGLSFDYQVPGASYMRRERLAKLRPKIPERPAIPFSVSAR